jgi:predicted ATPase
MGAIASQVSMTRHVLTGAPGAGKTSVLRILQEQGLAVVEEAATDVISREQRQGVAEPWRHAGFIDKITELQRQRQQEAVARGVRVQVHDRSPLCTVALARYLGHPVTPLLAGEVARMIREHVYEQPVFLLCPLGFITATAARRISYADSVEFGALHERVYQEHGYGIVHVAAGTAASRAAAIADLIAWRR